MELGTLAASARLFQPFQPSIASNGWQCVVGFTPAPRAGGGVEGTVVLLSLKMPLQRQLQSLLAAPPLPPFFIT